MLPMKKNLQYLCRNVAVARVSSKVCSRAVNESVRMPIRHSWSDLQRGNLPCIYLSQLFPPTFVWRSCLLSPCYKNSPKGHYVSAVTDHGTLPLTACVRLIYLLIYLYYPQKRNLLHRRQSWILRLSLR